MADGSIHIPVEIDAVEAEKRLKQLERDINKTQNALNKNNEKRDGITAQLQTARAEAEKTAETVRRIKQEMGDNESAMKTARNDEEYYGRYNRQQDLQERLEKANALYKTQTDQVANIEKNEQKVLSDITEQTSRLEKLDQEHKNIETSLARQSVGAYPQIRDQIEKASDGLKKGLKNILKWGIGIRSTFILVRRLRSAITEGVKAFAEQNEETKSTLNTLKSSLSALKGAWGAAFAPIVNLVGPYLKRLIDWLIDAANAVQMFFSMIGGRNTYKKVIANNNNLADSYSATGAAAAKATKQILGFDEINQLNDNSGGGGGGTGKNKSFNVVDEAINAQSPLAIAFNDIFLDWGDLNPEKVAEKIVAGITIFLSAAAGFSLAGIPGALVGTVSGVLLSLNVVDAIFDHDGKISEDELRSMLEFALNGLLGGVAGFLFTGSVKGAFLGATAAVAITALIKKFQMEKGTGLLGDLLTVGNFTTLLASITGMKVGAKFGGGMGAVIGLTFGAALGMMINDFKAYKGNELSKGQFVLNLIEDVLPFVGGSIGWVVGTAIPGLGNVAGAAIGATIGLAISLVIKDIQLGNKRKSVQEMMENSKIGRQLQEIQKQIKSELEVDEDLKVRIRNITGQVDETTMVDIAAAQKLINDIFDLDATENKTAEQIAEIQTKIEALNALGLEGIKLTFDPVTQSVQGTRSEVQGLLDDLLRQYQMEAMRDAYIESYRAEYDAARNVENATATANSTVDAHATAVENLTTAQNNYNAALAEYQRLSDEYGGYWLNGEDEQAYQNTVGTAKLELEAAQLALQEAEEAQTQAGEVLESAISTYNDAKAKTTEIGAAFADGFVEGVESKSETTEASMLAAAQAALDALTSPEGLDEHSPSKKTEEIGENAMEGFALGVEGKQTRVLEVIQSVMDAALAKLRESVDAMKAIWNSDWGRPRIRIPMFSLRGAFDFGTGQTPQISVADRYWAAKGGILNRATLIGAGEAGKEAILPLERNTEWIDMVVDGMVDRLVSSNRRMDYVSGLPLPALASGQVVPPRALTSSGSLLSDGDIDRLVSGIVAAFGETSTGEDNVTRLYLDGVQIAECVNKHNRRIAMERGL